MSILSRFISFGLFCVMAAQTGHLAWATSLRLPVHIPYSYLDHELKKRFFTAQGQRLFLRRDGPCQYLVLDDPQFMEKGALLGFRSHGKSSFGVLQNGVCNGVGWRGHIELGTQPYVTDDLLLKFKLKSAQILDEAGRRPPLVEGLWSDAKQVLFPVFESWSIDLAPGLKHVASLPSRFLPPDKLASFNTAIKTLKAGPLRAGVDGVNTSVSIAWPQALPVRQKGPSGSLSESEKNDALALLGNMDAFVGFVAHHLAQGVEDPDIQDEVIDVLLSARYAITEVLEQPRSVGRDRVREAFAESWDRLGRAASLSIKKGDATDNMMIYSLFIRGHDLLSLFDQLGVDISENGLRKLARVLAPYAKVDPLTYRWDEDALFKPLLGNTGR